MLSSKDWTAEFDPKSWQTLDFLHVPKSVQRVHDFIQLVATIRRAVRCLSDGTTRSWYDGISKASP